MLNQASNLHLMNREQGLRIQVSIFLLGFGSPPKSKNSIYLASSKKNKSAEFVLLVMGEGNSASSSSLSMGTRVIGSSDRELLMSVADDTEDVNKPSSSPPSSYQSGREAFGKVLRSWASKKFMSGCVILFPIAITFYITWWFIHFVDGFFSPIYAQLGINVFGLGFVTSIIFIFLVGVFVSSWMGASVLSLGEWFIKRMPLIKHIYSASKQISAAISPDPNHQAFKEVAIIRHPRMGEYAFGFITSTIILQNDMDEEELCCVYVPTNHLYIGDIILINSKDVIRPNLSVREGIEIVISGGMSMPQVISPFVRSSIQEDRNRSVLQMVKFENNKRQYQMGLLNV